MKLYGQEALLHQVAGAAPSATASPTPTPTPTPAPGATPNVEPGAGATLQTDLNGIGANNTALLDCGTYHVATDGGGLLSLNPPAGQSVIGCTSAGVCNAVSAAVPGSPPCAILDGAVTLPTWTQTTLGALTVWHSPVLTGNSVQNTSGGGTGSQCNDGTRACQFQQDLFMTPNANVSGGNVNDLTKTVVVYRTLNATLTSPAPPVFGGCMWYFDFSGTDGPANEIWTSCNPANHLVELTVANYAFKMTNANVTIQNLAIYGFATPIQRQTVETDSDANTVEENWVTHNHGEGIGGCNASGNGNQFLYNESIENGESGINTSGNCSNTTVDHNKFVRNNEDGTGWGFEAGGSKFDGDAGHTVTNNSWLYNNGNGLWFDDDASGGTVSGNIITGNEMNGSPIEVSHDLTFTNNTYTNNDQASANLCVANHIPVIFAATGNVAHDVCTGPQTMSPSYTACQGGRNEVHIHEAWNITFGTNGHPNTINSNCAGVQLVNNLNRRLMCNDLVEYNNFNLTAGGAVLNSRLGGNGASAATPTKGTVAACSNINNVNFWAQAANNLWDHNHYTFDSHASAILKQWNWGFPAGCNALTGTAGANLYTFGGWNGCLGAGAAAFDINGTNGP